MKAKMNFYTVNGWCGSNYESGLSIKEIASKVREHARKNFPGFKFSIRIERGSLCGTPSLYIEMKGGPVAPFVEGSRSYGRGYMSTCSSVKPFKDELTPEVFEVLDSLVTYASSYRYDDSDSMQDYFDSNFYLFIRVSDEYEIIERKAKKAEDSRSVEASAADAAAPAIVSASSVLVSDGLELVDYSDKAVAVFGDTKAVKEHLKELGGRFNPSLNYNGSKRAGWIFSKKKADELRRLFAPEAAEEAEEVPEVSEAVCLRETGANNGAEAYSFGNIMLKETGYLCGVCYFDVEGAGVITRVKVREDIQPGDIFSVYTDKERKYGVMYDGVSLCRSLYNDLPSLIEFDSKVESNILSRCDYYELIGEAYAASAAVAEVPGDCTESAEAAGVCSGADGEVSEARHPEEVSRLLGVVAYEKTCAQGKRYEAKELKCGGWWLVNVLGNYMYLCASREEAEEQAAYLNERTDSRGRLVSAV